MTVTRALETNKPPAIDKDLARELANYKGRWVAVDEIKKAVVGFGASAAEAVAAALARGVTDPLVFRVPIHARRVRIR